MSIIWKYLDKRSAAVDALKDYSSMKFIIANTSSVMHRGKQIMMKNIFQVIYIQKQSISCYLNLKITRF